MKNFLVLFLFFSICRVGSVLAQKSEVIEVKENLNGILQNALNVIAYDCDMEWIEKSFKTLMKKHEPAKISNSKEFILAEGVLIHVVNLNKMNIYLHADQLPEGTKCNFFFELSENKYLSSTQNHTDYKAACKFVYDFVIQIRKEKVMNELAEAKNLLLKLDRDLEEQKRDLQNMQRSIEGHKESIVKTENEIELNKLKQEKTANDISNQKVVIDKIKDKQANVE